MAEEESTKAIPIRRARNAPRGVRSGAAGATPAAGWTDSLLGGIRTVLAPPRQVWLAGLGGGRLGWQRVRGAWQRLVAEGTDVERQLRDRLGDVLGW